MKDGMLNSQQKQLVDLRWDITLKVIPQILYSFTSQLKLSCQECTSQLQISKNILE